MCTVNVWNCILYFGLYFLCHLRYILEIKSETKRKQWKGDCQVETKSVLSLLNERWDNRSQGSTITHFSNLSQNKEYQLLRCRHWKRRKDLDKSKQWVTPSIPRIFMSNGVATHSITVQCCNNVVTHSMELQQAIIGQINLLPSVSICIHYLLSCHLYRL